MTPEREQEVYEIAKAGMVCAMEPEEIAALIEAKRIAEEAFEDVMYQEFSSNKERILDFRQDAEKQLRAQGKIG